MKNKDTKDTRKLYSKEKLIQIIENSKSYKIREWLFFKIAKLLNINAGIVYPYVRNIKNKYGIIKNGKYLSE